MGFFSPLLDTHTEVIIDVIWCLGFASKQSSAWGEKGELGYRWNKLSH